MYVCVYVYLHTYMYIHKYTHLFIHIYTYIYIHVYVHLIYCEVLVHTITDTEKLSDLLSISWRPGKLVGSFSPSAEI